MKRIVTLGVLFIATAIAWPALPAARGDVTVVKTPPTNRTNSYYVSNRPPLTPSPLIKLPVGAIEPRGWLRRQLRLEADGFVGHLEEISHFLRKENNAWLSPTGQGRNGWEEVPYWLRGFSNLAFVLGDKRLVDEAKFWINAVMASQREDGYFGPRANLKGWHARGGGKGKPDLWPHMIMLFTLQNYYEYSQDKRVIDLMTKYFRWELSIPDEDFLRPYWQQQRGGDNLLSVYWLYNRTGDKWLLELATKIFRHTADWTDGIPNWHNVNMSQAFRGPETYWQQSKDPKHKLATERDWREIRARYGQVPGGMFGGDENCRPGHIGPRQAVETCGMVEKMHSDEILLAIDGELKWADRCEDVAFNSLPAATTPDFKALRYLTAPNLVRSDTVSKRPGVQNGGPMFWMNPHIHRCCQHNMGQGWPYYAEHLWYATPDNGLAAVFYSASKVTAKVGDAGTKATIEQATHYPFDEHV
ncbi:MAG: glycoside hydrolase family 127 protein, partial [Planctomycetes bacterium]|nr:glycoside hydrolase family 127 protein [Planctomycetota bacterium]